MKKHLNFYVRNTNSFQCFQRLLGLYATFFMDKKITYKVWIWLFLYISQQKNGNQIQNKYVYKKNIEIYVHICNYLPNVPKKLFHFYLLNRSLQIKHIFAWLVNYWFFLQHIFRGLWFFYYLIMCVLWDIIR